jgi:UDP-N-acetylglucosamine:LPS N-acetylglucosamine transferase
MRATERKRVLAIASGGGHWVELLRVVPAFAGHDVAFATVSPAYRSSVPGARFYTVPDATQWQKLGLVRLALRVLWILLRERPHVVVSTGAAPGYLGLRLGKLLGARTVWIDSIANAEELSLSGRRIGQHADLWLTQWPHLARPQGPRYAGAVL